MLPIANRKTLQIPHGLAALAAVICLVLAFAADHVPAEQDLRAEQTGISSPVEQAAEEIAGDERSQPAFRDRREQRSRLDNLTLIPWLPVPGGGRG
jgi:hypothetical protein